MNPISPFEKLEDMTPLEKAAVRGDTDALTKLFPQHIDPNLASGHHAGGALAVACFYRQEEAAKLLIDHKADIKMRTKEGKTAFDLAVASNNKGVASVLTPDCDCNPH